MGVVRDFEKYRRFNLRELQASGILDENAGAQEKAIKAEEQAKAIKAEEPKVEEPVVQVEATEDAKPEEKPEEKPETAVEA